MDPDGSNRYKIAKHIVGFANRRGGRLVFGVNDDGNPEGAELKEEMCLSTISEIVSTKCSPSINFSHEFYSENRGDLSEGSVFVLRIEQRTNLPPVAIVDRSEGKIRKREYRIRSGDSTRLVSDGELVSLFEDGPKKTIERKNVVKYSHTEDMSPVDLNPQPRYFHWIDEVYSDLEGQRDEIVELITTQTEADHELTEYHTAFQIILTTIILRDLYNINTERQVENIINRLNDQDLNPVCDFHGGEISYPDLDDKYEDIIETLPFDPEEFIKQNESHNGDEKENGFWIPSGSKLDIHDNFSGFTISSDGEFQVSAEIQWRMLAMSLPAEHPSSNAGRFSGSEYDKEKRTIEVHINFNAKFEYPKQSYDAYRTYFEYCDQIWEGTISNYDWEEFSSDIPNKKLFKIEERLEEMNSKLDEISK
ncbi:hypothetical protein JCM17823_12400 [Halorubrum gandharaense]